MSILTLYMTGTVRHVHALFFFVKRVSEIRNVAGSQLLHGHHAHAHASTAKTRIRLVRHLSQKTLFLRKSVTIFTHVHAYQLTRLLPHVNTER